MGTKLKLCSFKTCPWVHRAAIVLQAKEIEYDIEYINRNKRPDWFEKISPHSKVPVLIIDGKHAIFESNAISEYLDELVEPQLHPKDPIVRAYNRAWTDYLPTFNQITHISNAVDKNDFLARVEKSKIPAGRIEIALRRRGNDGPFFNGKKMSLVDAAYAPALLRFSYLEQIKPTGLLDDKPKLNAWKNHLIECPEVLRAVVPDFFNVWKEQVRNQHKWLAQFLPPAKGNI